VTSLHGHYGDQQLLLNSANKPQTHTHALLQQRWLQQHPHTFFYLSTNAPVMISTSNTTIPQKLHCLLGSCEAADYA